MKSNYFAWYVLICNTTTPYLADLNTVHHLERLSYLLNDTVSKSKCLLKQT